MDVQFEGYSVDLEEVLIRQQVMRLAENMVIQNDSRLADANYRRSMKSEEKKALVEQLVKIGGQLMQNYARA